MRNEYLEPSSCVHAYVIQWSAEMLPWKDFLTRAMGIVLNGFYMAMRNEYLEPSSCVHAYVIQWSAEMLPWKDFLTRAMGIVLNGFYMAMRNEYLEPSSCVHAYVIQWSAEMLPWKDFLTRAMGIVLNGFYMAMRNEYLEPSSCVHAYVIQWSAEMLPWKDFLTRAIGSSDPSKALPDSLRRTIYDRYRYLEMEERPNEFFNAIHASESPLEGLAERLNWSFSKTVQQDEFGKTLLGKGIPESKILEWCENSKVSMSRNDATATIGGRYVDVAGMMDIFDVVKGMDTRECLDTLIQVYDCELFGSKEGREHKRKRRRRRRIIHRTSSVDNEAMGGCCIIS
eukprot:CAMPEP_0176492178 /NCGR_PEP_ID=MMETSP0200_2-20121128/8845_1 /TAXON_ID=947934 /ORGANISM="Chaetoceros sp., Strain GSL56" /LENGTH=339 /DNA_ID=CAMNT_0017889693 /DNA_START=813 /DNA_END=1835 /DNA_ORIENTATION=-